MLTTHLKVEQRLRMTGAIHLLPLCLTGILSLPLRVPLQMEVNDQFHSPTAFYIHRTETISLVSAFQSDIPLLFSFISINKDNPFMLWERKEMHTKCWCANLTKRGHSEEPGVYGTVLCKWILRKQDGTALSDYCSVERGKWQALVNMLMNLWVHKMQEIQPAQEPLASPEGLCDMQLVD